MGWNWPNAHLGNGTYFSFRFPGQTLDPAEHGINFNLSEQSEVRVLFNLPYKLKVQYVQYINIAHIAFLFKNIKENIMRSISGPSTPVVKGRMTICLIWSILPIDIDELCSSPKFFMNRPK